VTDAYNTMWRVRRTRTTEGSAVDGNDVRGGAADPRGGGGRIGGEGGVGRRRRRSRIRVSVGGGMEAKGGGCGGDGAMRNGWEQRRARLRGRAVNVRSPSRKFVRKKFFTSYFLGVEIMGISLSVS
jgi:hypothetical protein